MIKSRHILLLILAMLFVNGVAMIACNGDGNNSSIALCEYSSVVNNCAGDCDYALDDCDAHNQAQNTAELMDYEQPMRVCSTRPLRVLSSRIGGSRTLLGVSGCEPNGRILKCNFGGERCHSASKPFPMRFFASERVVALRRIIC